MRKGLFRGHKRDAEVKNLLDKTLPKDFEHHASLAQGDCFFDSAAQSVSCIKKEHYTAKGLRLISRDYVIELDKKPRVENWIYQRFLTNAKQLNQDDNKAKETADREYQHYMANIGYTQEEINNGQGLNIQQAIWGEQDIDGRILREVLKIHLHLIEFHEIEGQLVVSHQMDDKSIQEASVGYAAPDTVHIAVFNSHFVPLLSKSAAMLAVSVNNPLENKAHAELLEGDIEAEVANDKDFWCQEYNNAPHLLELQEASEYQVLKNKFTINDSVQDRQNTPVEFQNGTESREALLENSLPTKTVQQHSKIANDYIRQNCLEEALKTYETLTGYSPRENQTKLYADSYRQLGSLYHVQLLRNNNPCDIEKAQIAFERAISLYSTAHIYCDYGLFLYQQGQPEKAIIFLKQAISLPEDNNLLNYTCLDKARLPIQLQWLLEKHEQITVNPHLFAYYLLVKSHTDMSRSAQAASIFQSFEQIAIKHIDVTGYALLAAAYACLDKPEIAKSYQEQAVALSSLLSAYQIKNRYSQTQALAQMAECYFTRKDYLSAAKLLNGAIALSRNLNNAEEFQATLVKRLKQLEVQFIENELQRIYPIAKGHEAYGLNIKHQIALDNLRKEVKAQLALLQPSSSSSPFITETLSAFIAKQGNSVDSHQVQQARVLSEQGKTFLTQWLFKFIAYCLKQLLHDMLQDCIYLLGEKPPCDYALLALGSLAREEATPYSDLECVLLIEDITDTFRQLGTDNAEELGRHYNKAHCSYFQSLCYLLELKIINLGETDLIKGEYLLPLDIPSFIRKGFSLDIHKKPTNQIQKLIGTPTELAAYQLPDFFINDSHNHLSRSLITVALITGQRTDGLIGTYCQAIKAYHQKQDDSLNQPLYISRTLDALADHLDTFAPKLTPLMDEGRLFEVKDELYRLPNVVFDALALYFHLASNSTWDRIDELCHQQRFNQVTAQQLTQALCKAMLLRLQTHFYYEAQYEVVDALSNSKGKKKFTSNVNNVFGLKQEDVVSLSEIYRIILPFYGAVTGFYTYKGQIDYLYNLNFTKSHYIEGLIAQRLCLYQKAKEEYLKACEEQPENLLVINLLVAVLCELGEYSAASEQLKKLIEIDKRLPSTIHTIDSTANYYNNLGYIQLMLGDPHQAIKTLKLGFKVGKKQLFNETPKIDLLTTADTINSLYTNMGNAYIEIGDNKTAIKFHRIALNNRKELYGERHPMIILALHNLGNDYRIDCQIDMAFDYLTQALAISRQFYGNNHPNVARELNSLSLIYAALRDFKQALAYAKEALILDKHIYGKNHPVVARDKNNLGTIYHKLAQFSKAENCFQQALAIDKNYYNGNHLNLATDFMNLASLAGDMGRFKEAISCGQQSLEINTSLYGERHPAVIRSYVKIGNSYLRFNQTDKALDFFNKALTLCKQIHKKEHPNIALTYSSLGSLYNALGNFNKAIDYYHKALAIYRKFYPEVHTEILELQINLISAQAETGNIASEKGKIEQQLQNLISVYGDNYFPVAKIYFMLGKAYLEMGDFINSKFCFNKALTIFKEICDNRNELIINTMVNLGIAELKANHFESAFSYYQNALSLSIEVYGENYSSTGLIYLQLASAHRELHEFDKAHAAIDKSLKIIEAFFGADNYALVAVFYENGLIYKKSGNSKEAHAQFVKALTINQKARGEKHYINAQILDEIGLLWLELDNFEPNRNHANTALKYFKEALDVYTFDYGYNNQLKIGITLSYIGDVMRKLNCLPEAIDYYKQSRKLITITNKDVIALLDNLGATLIQNGDPRGAIEYLDEALRGLNKLIYGKTYAAEASILNTLSEAYLDLENMGNATKNINKAIQIDKANLNGRQDYRNLARDLVTKSRILESDKLQKAIEYGEKALRIYEIITETDYYKLTFLLNHLAMLYQDAGKISKAIDYFKVELRLTLACYKIEDLEVGLILNNLGDAYREAKKYPDAMACLKQALIIYKKHQGNNDIDTAITVSNMAKVWRDIGMLGIAIRQFKKAYKICLDIVGLQHEYSIKIKCYLDEAKHIARNKKTNLFHAYTNKHLKPGILHQTGFFKTVSNSSFEGFNGKNTMKVFTKNAARGADLPTNDTCAANSRGLGG